MTKTRWCAAIGACGVVLGMFSDVGSAAEATVAIMPQPLKLERKEVRLH